MKTSRTRKYDFGPTLGQGIDGVVRLCTDRRSGCRLACKSIPKSNPSSVRHILNEISFLENLLRGHPNILCFHDQFEDRDHIHLVVDLCEGGDLCEYIQENGPLSEAQASEAMAAILKAVSFCHSRGIMHRDLKAENILFPRLASPFSELKLADFGAAADFSRTKEFRDLEGTPWYLAPDVLMGKYDERVDIWSLGVLLYIMLSGYPPFRGEETRDIFAAIRRGRIDLHKDPWPSISDNAKSLLQGMLQRNPHKRMKLKDLLFHPWIQRAHKF